MTPHLPVLAAVLTLLLAAPARAAENPAMVENHVQACENHSIDVGNHEAAGCGLFVDDDKAQCPYAAYTTVQAAVNAAANGNTIKICPGTYNEAVTVNKDNLTIRGSTGNRADVTVSNDGIPFTLSGAATTLKDMTVTSANNKGVSRGGTASPSAYTFENLAITAKKEGVYIAASAKITFTNINVTSSTDDAIHLEWETTGAHVFDAVTATGKKYGIYTARGGAMFKDVTVKATDNDAIYLHRPDYDATFTNVAATSLGGDGISIGWAPSGKTMTLSNMNVRAKNRGIYIDTSAALSIQDSAVSSSNGNAIEVGWGANGAHVLRNLTLDAFGSGIYYNAAAPSAAINAVCVNSGQYGVQIAQWHAKNIAIGGSKFTSTVNGVSVAADPAYKTTVSGSCIMKSTVPRAASNNTSHTFNGNYWLGVAGGTSYVDGNVRDTSTLANCPVTSCYAPPLICDPGYVPVPETTLPDGTAVPAFCVMQFEAKNVGGTATSQAAAAPWTSITWQAAGNACTAAGTTLIGENQWLSIAHQATAIGSNWTGGGAGGGAMFSGHNDNSPGNALAVSDTSNPWSDTGNSAGSTQRRTLVLANGSVIWDLAGNVWEWVNQTIPIASRYQGGAGQWMSYSVDGFPVAGNVPQAKRPPNNWNANQGMGRYYDGFTTSGAFNTVNEAPDNCTGPDCAPTAAFVRGGAWYLGDYVGAFTLDLGKGRSYAGSEIGFRCTQGAPAPAGPDHYELSLPSTGISCLPVTATVTACADSTSPCANKYTAASGKTAALATSVGTLSATTVTFDATGTASATLNHPSSAANGATVTVTLSSEEAVATNPRKCCPDGTACVVRDTCTTSFATGGLIFSASSTGAAAAPPTQVSGLTSGTHYLRAVKTNTTTKACESAVSGARNVGFAYTCVDPATCTTGDRMTLGGQTFGAAGTSTAALTFDATTGAAPFTLKYNDAGKLHLSASVAADNGAILSGSTPDPFVVKPAALCVYSTELSPCAAADATCPKAKKAGETFNLTVAAVRDGYDCANPDTWRTPNYKATGITLGRTLVAPAAGASGTPGVASLAIDANGYNSAQQSISEVGVFKFTAAPPAYFGEAIGGGVFESGALGRFYPDRFVVTLPSITPFCGGATGFTYFGQDGFTTGFTLTALNTAGTTTANYTGSFAKLDIANRASHGFAATGLPTGSSFAAGATPITGTWGNGTATIAARHQASRPTNLTGPTTIDVTALPVDPDGVTMPAAAALGSPVLYTGRARLLNANGSELLALPVPFKIEYYSGATKGWQKNTADTCTAVANGNFAFVFPTGTVPKPNNLAACETAVTVGGASPSFTLSLAKPGAGNNGWADLTLNLGTAAGNACTAVGTASPAASTVNAPWLQYDWKGAGLANPTARATFGVFRSGAVIFMRESY